jgi:hypothetical protein
VRAAEAQRAFGATQGKQSPAAEQTLAAARTNGVKTARPAKSGKGSRVAKASKTSKRRTTTERIEGRSMPAKIAAVVDGFRVEAEQRYARKVWKFLTKQRTSSPAKTDLTSERAAAIFKRVETVV